MDETFGQMVKRMRKARRWSQEELGQRAGLDQATVSLVERGKGRHTVLTVTGLAGAFDQTGANVTPWLRQAGVLPPLPAEAMPPQPPDEQATGDTPFTPAMIVAYVESHPDPRFRADLAEEAEYMSPEDYEQYCANIFRAWSANGDLAKRTARLMRGRRDVTK